MEIERKFLLKNDEWRKSVSSRIHIKQGYICSDLEHVVRIRITDSKAFITIKGKNTNKKQIAQISTEATYSVKLKFDKRRKITEKRTYIYVYEEACRTEERNRRDKKREISRPRIEKNS